MVKGVSKRVIVVKTPVSSLFEQAIFILGDNALATSQVDAENLLHEACAVADDYVRSHCGAKTRPSFPIPLIISITALVTFLFSFFLFKIFHF